MVKHEHSWCIMTTHGASCVLMMHRDYTRCIMTTHDASWVLMMHPICHQMVRHGSWEDFNQANLDDFSVRVLAMFEISKLPLFCWGFYCFYVILKGSRSNHGSFRDHRWSIWRQSGTPVTMLCWSDLSRNPKSWKSTFECFLWRFSTKLWAIDAESTPCYLQPSIYIKNSIYTAQAAVMLFKLDKARNHKKDTHAKPSKWPAPHHRSSGFCNRSCVW